MVDFLIGVSGGGSSHGSLLDTAQWKERGLMADLARETFSFVELVSGPKSENTKR